MIPNPINGNTIQLLTDTQGLTLNTLPTPVTFSPGSGNGIDTLAKEIAFEASHLQPAR